MGDVRSRILDFAVYCRYTGEDEILQIASGLCDRYGWDGEEDYREGRRGKEKAWEVTVRAAKEHRDPDAIATVLFLKEYSPEIGKTGYCITTEALLIEMIELLESILKKDALILFLIARANFNGRGAELDLEKARECFFQAAKGGFPIAELFALELQGDWNAIFSVATKLKEDLPDSHVVRFYLAYCCYHGHGTAPDYAGVLELAGFAGDLDAPNLPLDYYSLGCRYLLGLCSFHGYATEKDLETALRLFRFCDVSYLPEARYALAIATLLSDEKKCPREIWELLEQSALRGVLPAARKAMLCLRKCYGVEGTEAWYTEYADYYDHEKELGVTVSDLGYEADHCDLVDENGKRIPDDEID